MGFNDLKLDIIIDIFYRYISTTPYGPFILTTVCSAWKDFVITIPRLWTFIVVDELNTDWKQLFDVSVTLSQDLPVTITLNIPCSRLVFLRPYIHRIRLLHLHVTDTMEQEDTIDTLTQLHTEQITYTGHVKWTHHELGDIYISPVDHTQYTPIEYYRNWRTDILKTCLGPRGVFFTDFSAEKFLQYCDSELVWRSATSLSNLARLRLRARVFSPKKPIPQYNLYLPRLIELEMLFERHGDRNTMFQALINRIRAPKLETVRATALHSADFEDTLRFIHRDVCPYSLHLKLSGLHFGQLIWNSRLPELQRLEELHIDLRFSAVSETVAAFFIVFMRRFPNLRACFVSVDETSYPIISFLAEAQLCPIHIHYLAQKRPPEMPTSSQDSIMHLDSLTLGADITKENHLLRNAKRLEFTSTNEHQIMVSPEYWNPGIESIQSEGCYFTADVFDNPERVIQNTHIFQNLTTMDCPITVVNFLIQWGLVPSLQSLSISVLHEFDDDAEEFHTLTEILCLQTGESAYSGLRRLSLKFFPPWRECFRLIFHLVHQLSHSEDFILELPSLPDSSILQPLIASLQGRSVDSWFVDRERASYRRYCRTSRQIAPGCYYCYNSGWSCFSRMLGAEEQDHIYLRRVQVHCQRHSVTNLVPISKNTV